MNTKCFILSLLAATIAASPAGAQIRLKLPSDAFLAAQAAAPSGQTSLPVPQTPGDNRPRVSLTLENAVTRALENNLDISVQRINQQTYDVSIASLESVYSPTVTSTVSNQTTRSASTSTISGARSAGDTINTETLNFNAGLNQAVRFKGGSFSLNMNNSRQETTSLNQTYNPQFNGLISAIYSQPLLRNFSIDTNRQQILVTKINQDISDLDLQATTLNTVANVRNAYWDYVFAVQFIEVSRQSLDLAEELLRNNQTRVEIGTMAPIDVVQAQTQAAAARQQLVTAEGARRTAEIALKRLIVNGTADPVWSSTIEPVDRPDFLPEPIDLAAATDRALRTRTDVLEARKTLEANAVTLNYLQNQTMPQTDMTARYQTTGVGGTRFDTTGNGVNREVTGIVPGGYLDAFGTLFRQRLPTWSLAINFSYPLGMSAAKASVARTRIQQNQIEVQLKQLDLQVTSDVSNAAVQVQNSVERVQAAQAARDLAQQQLDAENSKFGVGMSTNFQVVQAQRDLATAQNNELQAILAYRKAVVEFERVQQTGNGGNIIVFGR